MPLPQSSLDAESPQRLAERPVPAVHPHSLVIRGYELLGQMRVAMAELSNILGALRDENSVLRADKENNDS